MIKCREQLVHWDHYGLTHALLVGVNPYGLMVNYLWYCEVGMIFTHGVPVYVNLINPRYCIEILQQLILFGG